MMPALVSLILRRNLNSFKKLPLKTQQFSSFLKLSQTSETGGDLTKDTTQPFFNSKYKIQGYESNFAFTILTKLDYSQNLGKTTLNLTHQEFEDTLSKNYRDASTEIITNTFKNVQKYSLDNGIPLSDRRFDNLVDGLMDNCEKLSEFEIISILECLTQFPKTETVNSHNFVDVWSCLDDMCCWRMREWQFEVMFRVAALWYQLGLSRVGDFTFEVIDKLTLKTKRLTKNEILWTFFLLSVCRRHTIDFVLEDRLLRTLNDYTVDELGVIAQGFFKTRSKLKIPQILAHIIDQIIAQKTTITDITLTSLLKIIRLTRNFKLTTNIHHLLDSLTDQIPRLSTLTCIHIALCGTTVQLRHDQTLNACVHRILNSVHRVRLKDLERIALACTMLAYRTPETHALYAATAEILQNPSVQRRVEMARHPRSLLSTLYYLTLDGIYVDCLISDVLRPDRVKELYGNSGVGGEGVRELLCLDTGVECERDGVYRGERLELRFRYKAAKYWTEWAPSRDLQKKLTNAQACFLELKESVEKVAGGEDLVRVDHILPQFSRADVITCWDKFERRFVEPKGFSNYILGDIKRPPFLSNSDNVSHSHSAGDRYHWCVAIVLCPNTSVRYTNEPLGEQQMKARQLSLIGYKPFFVVGAVFSELSEAEKHQFLLKNLTLNT